MSYLRHHNQVSFDSMRRFNLPKQMIKQILLEEVKQESIENLQ
ncbi:hypothetical protein [uncultured Gammaproteobacteria bacterium]|nr:hypothetical protein [uncultured Gammaproteobacteria bacterium]CAC9599048.1 hypothetical protein [uncultured Gammaproteobacteria bacterium]